MSHIPPIALQQPYALEQHGHTRHDPYYWLRERDNPDVIAYLEAENAYAVAQMAETKDLQTTLFTEMKGRIQETDQSVVVPRGDYLYYTRTEAGRQYAIYCRRHAAPGSEEQILLDLNALAEGKAYMRLGVFRPSADNRILAYALDETGAETYTLRCLDMTTGEHLPDVLHEVGYSAEWSADGRFLFYTTEDHAKRDHRLWRHALGTTQVDDVLIFEEPDELYRVGLSKTQDDAFLVLHVLASETTERHLLSAGEPEGAFRVVEPRQRGLRYAVDHRDGTLYIVTNADDAPNNKIVTVSADAPGRDSWRDFLPHDPERYVLRAIPFQEHLVVHQRRNGLAELRVYTFATDSWHTIELAEPVYEVWPATNPAADTTIFRYTYTSLTTPLSTYAVDMHTGTTELLKQEPVLGGYDAADYVTERLWATAEDGTQVPISLVRRHDVPRDGTAPMLLIGYGSYGYSYPVSFDFKRLVFLERGYSVAIAHIRGGGEMGRHWVDQGKFTQKKNTFTDFITCARHLIDAGYTSADRLAIAGRSAGGLLMGAAINLAPELFNVVYAGVPFVDVVTTMLDTSIPLTVGEFDEWGNPQEPSFYEYMLSYSPYDNIRPQAYPHMLVTAGLNDPRVQYWEPAKWVARLRTARTDNNKLLLKTHMGAGHFSSSGRYDYLRDYAFEYAFILTFNRSALAQDHA